MVTTSGHRLRSDDKGYVFLDGRITHIGGSFEFETFAYIVVAVRKSHMSRQIVPYSTPTPRNHESTST